MNRTSLRTALLVARKELIESLRDRRTLFVAMILPVLIYPIVTLGLGPVISMQKRKLAETTQRVAVTGPDRAAVLERVFVPYEQEPGEPPKPPSLEIAETADPAADLAERKIQLWVEAREGFAEALASKGTATVRVRYDGADDPSREAWAKWRDAFEAAARRELDRRLVAQGLPEAWRSPLRMDAEDVAPPEQTGAYIFGRILAMLLVLMTLTSSFYPAVDAVAGEKERGTMETLLVAPCGRVELVVGKFLAVLAVTLVAALLNLGSLALTSGPLLGALGPEKLATLQVTPTVLIGIFVLLVPLAALFSAVSLSLSTMARSVKEAQHYLSPLVMLVMPLAMVVILPNLPLTQTLAAVPVTNAVLFFRDLLLGRTEWGTTITVMASTFGFAALAIWASVLLFLREETLFRGPEGTGSPVRRPAPRALPTAPAAVFLFALSFAGLWYAQGVLPTSIVANVLVTQIAVVAAPCLAFAWWLRLDVGRTFRLTRPTGGAWVAALVAVPLGLALPIVSAAIHHAVAGGLAPDGALRAIDEQMKALVRDSSALRIVLLLGVLPGVCEELVYRGFVLSGLRQAWTSRRGAVAAVLVTAAFFALSHVFPEKWANTFVMGAILGWLALRTGSIVPGIVAHAVHNGAAVLASKYEGSGWVTALYGDETSGLDGARVAAAVGASAVLLAVVHFTCARRGAVVRGT